MMNESPDYVDVEEHEIRKLEETETPLELQCIECGDEALGMCCCCGANLCSMHQEVQAGFCSSFTTIELESGDKIDATLNEIELDGVIEVLYEKELSGCVHERDDETDQIFIMETQPDEKPQLVGEEVRKVDEDE